MTQIPDAPYIRAADAAGYPTGGEDGEELDPGDCPVLRL